jgi:hypothetical protein
MKSIVSPIFKHFGCGRSFICVAAVLVTWLLSAGQAKASCGYYVQTGNPSAEMMASQEAMQVKHQASQPGKDCPCRGPNCSAGKSDAVIPSAAPVTSSSDHVAALAVTSTLLQEVRGMLVVSDASIQSESYLLSLDPPPRFPL